LAEEEPNAGRTIERGWYSAGIYRKAADPFACFDSVSIEFCIQSEAAVSCHIFILSHERYPHIKPSLYDIVKNKGGLQ
jgi:hypothetical protein